MNIDYNKVNTDFQAYYQKSIKDLKSGHPQYGETHDKTIINIQFDVLWGKIPKTQRVFDFDKMSDYQKDVFYKALIQQIYYVLTEGDFTAMSGFDVSKNTFLSAEDMSRVAISSAAKATLKNGGLLYAGLNGYNNGLPFPYPGRKFP